jgi:hypothetical protein
MLSAVLVINIQPLTCSESLSMLLLLPLLLLLLLCHVQVVEEGYEFFAKRQLVTIFSAPNYCGEFENAGAMMSVDETLMCSFQVRLLCFACFVSPGGTAP